MITITIEGSQGEGKSFIAKLIEKTLIKKFKNEEILLWEEEFSFIRRPNEAFPKVLIRTTNRFETPKSLTKILKEK